MAKIFSMQALVHLAHQKNDDATRKFGQLIQQQQAAQTKLHTLDRRAGCRLNRPGTRRRRRYVHAAGTEAPQSCIR